jgi:hypothetical protein
MIYIELETPEKVYIQVLDWKLVLKPVLSEMEWVKPLELPMVLLPVVLQHIPGKMMQEELVELHKYFSYTHHFINGIANK